MVTERQNEILNLVVDKFTKTHEPDGENQSLSPSSLPFQRIS